MGKTKYILALTNEDHLSIKLVSVKGRVKFFSVQYYAKIKHKWRTIMRMDNSHGIPHKHIYHLQSQEHKVELNQENSLAFNESKNYIQKNYQKIKDNYLNT